MGVKENIKSNKFENINSVPTNRSNNTIEGFNSGDNYYNIYENLNNNNKNTNDDNTNNTDNNELKARFFQHYAYDGWVAELPIGNYTNAQLRSQHRDFNSMSSVRVPEGLKVTLYREDNFTDINPLVLTSDSSGIGAT